MATNFKDRVIEILKKHQELSAYKLISVKTTDRELFLIKDKLDLNRGKDVENYSLTVYRDFEEQGVRYKGSALLSLAPTMSEEELEKKISDGIFAAQFVKTKWYPLAKPSDEKLLVPHSDIDEKKLGEQAKQIAEAILAEKSDNAVMNSAEIFLTCSDIHFINSEGVNLRYKNASNKIEVITSCEAQPDAVEVYGDASYSNLALDTIRSTVKNQLEETEARRIAQRAQSIKGINVILRNSSVPDFFGFFVEQTSGEMVFSKSSKAEVGKNFQGEHIRGDAISITLKPFIDGSASSAPFDEDGTVLHDTVIFENGTVKNIHCNLKMAEYLHMKASGHIANCEVASGSLSYAEMTKEPYVEILRFSDFLCDAVTGDFGGEFRLAKYFDGKQIHIINNGALSANIFKVQSNMYFSKELMQYKAYRGPKAIFLPALGIAGA